MIPSAVRAAEVEEALGWLSADAGRQAREQRKRLGPEAQGGSDESVGRSELQSGRGRSELDVQLRLPAQVVILTASPFR